jgi:hypothetical protein
VPLRRAIGRLLHTDDEARLQGYRRLLAAARPDVATLQTLDQRLWRMLLAQLTDQVKAGGARLALQQAVDLLSTHPQVRSELVELLEVLSDRVDHLHGDLLDRPECPLKVHGRYTRAEVLAALGAGDPGLSQVPEWREGVKWLPEARTDAFLVTLDKAGGTFSPTTAYRDYALSRTLFHWESQSTTSADSPTGRRYRNHVAEGSSIYLFVRINNEERSFWFLGPATYVSHEESRPMAVTWRLTTPLPPDLHTEFAAVEVA